MAPPLFLVLELMPYDIELEKSIISASHMAKTINELCLKSDLRSRAASVCFAIAQQHHSAILILLSNKPPVAATALALLRLLLEATFRGLWVSHCASDEQVESFVSGDKKQLDMANVTKALGACFNKDHVQQVLHTKLWPVLSAYTHTYELQIQRWLGDTVIEPNYTDQELLWLLEKANSTMQLATSAVLALVNSADSNGHSNPS